MGIPLVVFYIIYLGLAAIFLLLSLLTIYHLIKYSKMDLVSIVIIFFYLAVASIIFLISWEYTRQIDWSSTIPLMSGFETDNTNLEL